MVNVYFDVIIMINANLVTFYDIIVSLVRLVIRVMVRNMINNSLLNLVSERLLSVGGLLFRISFYLNYLLHANVYMSKETI